ncbi:coiled-coil domain-containing protein 166 [Bufo gargarizans]|uniref:coiled-coil domain-containing protein 166 n=1 Tax=Bufo gargarizans TaxID=30331 RepID=UPI001CF18590|nr:coiled-coil domain-containing protein 166 [Bufo gargarizans]
MPPKKKSPGTVSRSPGGAASVHAEEGSEEKEVVVSEREVQLQDEHNQLVAEQEGLRRRLEQLRRENEFLQEESERVRVESQEYLLYMSKRSQRRQDVIISLNDQNQRELQNIQHQKQELKSKFSAEEKNLRDLLLRREAELANLRKELEELEPTKELQKEQVSLIKCLDDEVMAQRGKHAEAMLRVKSAFLREKTQCQQNSKEQLSQLSQKAQEEAKKALQEVSTKVKEENQSLRQELLHLIHQYRLLQVQKNRLEEKNKELLREQQCRDEVGNIQRKLKMVAILPTP